MALNAGFFNALNINGEYDRKYNADDYTNIFSAFISDGVRRSGIDDFKVSANGLVLTVKAGYAVVGGRWVHLDADITLPAITAPAGTYSRIDAVVLRVDANEATRAAGLFIRTGTAASTPTAPGKNAATGTAEVILAHVRIDPGATKVTLTDTRGNASLCGWITTPVGYNEYFTALDSAFEDWFQEKKDTLASTTLFKQYKWRTVLTSSESSITFDIPQYDSSGVDIIHVYVNGLLEIEGTDYTLNGSTITFGTGGGGSGTKVAGTEIVVLCYKSIDGTGLGTVSDEITAMQNTLNLLSDENEYIYVCNGKTDNVELSKIASDWLTGGTDYGSKIVRVYGTFGATSPQGGGGTSSNPYTWLALGKGAANNRKITFDFTGCSAINIACADNTHNIIFFGMNVNIIGANVLASGGAAIFMFSTAAATAIHAERCRFWITSDAGFIARGGTFKDCRCSLTVNGADGYAFPVLSGGLLRLFGGEYYAYAPTGNTSSVVYVGASQLNAVVNTYSLSCPNVARSGYVQTYAFLAQSNNAKCSFTDTITTLPVSGAGQNVRGTIPASMPNMI